MLDFLKKLLDEGLEAFIKYASGGDTGVYYINGSESLPPPLTREEEEQAFKLLETDFAAARETLIVHNLRLVVYIAKKFENTGVGLDDLVSIGTIGLIKAVNTFSVNRNIKLATYASRCIENEILMYLRKTSQRRCEISIDEPLNVDWDGNELLLSDVLGTDSDWRKRPNRGRNRKEAAPRRCKPSDSAGAPDHGNAVRAEGRQRENTERSRRRNRDFSELYFKAGKAHYKAASRRTRTGLQLNR